MYIRSLHCGGWPAVSRRDSGNKDRVRGPHMRVLMYVHFYSLGTLHNPIGAVASWCYTYTSTSCTHRVYAGCLVYYMIACHGWSLTPVGLGFVHLFVANLSPAFLSAGVHFCEEGRDVVRGWCTTCVFRFAFTVTFTTTSPVSHVSDLMTRKRLRCQWEQHQGIRQS